VLNNDRYKVKTVYGASIIQIGNLEIGNNMLGSVAMETQSSLLPINGMLTWGVKWH
jgi:hypothetical protein